jgi:hypothetical protein
VCRTLDVSRFRRCTAEQGSSSFVATHLAKAELAMQLPERYVLAQRRRAKIIDISGGKRVNVHFTTEPGTLLEQTFDEIQRASLVGCGDRDMVQFLLADFEWTIQSVMEIALRHSSSKYTTASDRGSPGSRTGS